MQDLTVLDLLDDKVLHAFLAVEMLTAGQEHELLTQDLPLAYATLMQLRVEISPVRLLR